MQSLTGILADLATAAVGIVMAVRAIQAMRRRRRGEPRRHLGDNCYAPESIRCIYRVRGTGEF